MEGCGGHALCVGWNWGLGDGRGREERNKRTWASQGKNSTGVCACVCVTPQSVTPPSRETSPREILPSVAWLNPTDGSGAKSCNNMPSVLQQDTCRSTSLASSCLEGGRKEESRGGWSKGEYTEREGLRHGQKACQIVSRKSCWNESGWSS